jgi:type I restriction enzyme S subunit
MIADLKPYAEYKELGLPWLGQVPGHWGTRRMKFLFRDRSEKGHPNEPLLAATQTKGVVRKEDYGLRTVTAVNGLENLKLVEVGDFVISLRSFQGGIEVSHARGIISPAYTVLCPRSGFDPNYFRVYFKCADFISSLTLFVTGIREGQNIDYVRLSRAFIPLPPPAEQAAIVRFLDWANGRLERAIRAKRKIVALLNEQKQAIIHRAVTRGLNPNVRLKPSGIPWLGEIPEHWEVRRAKYLFREVDERSKEGKETHLAMSQRLGLVPSTQVECAMRSESYMGAKLCKEGDLVLNRLKAHLGVFALAGQLGVISPDYTVFRKRAAVSMHYYESVLRSSACRRELRIRAKGLVEGFWRLYTDDFYNIRLPVPPLDEQLDMVSAIAAETSGANTAISRLEREITLLREYRTRLVADVVTGKLDVRAAAATLPDEVPLDAAPEEDLDSPDADESLDEEEDL